MFPFPMLAGMSGLMGGLGQTTPPGAKEATDALIKRQMMMQSGPKMGGQMAPPMPMPPQMQGPQSPRMGMSPPAPQGGIGHSIMGKLGDFAGNLDRNMQSPSKQLGIGLLGEIDPRLALGGLLAGGIFGGRNAP